MQLPYPNSSATSDPNRLFVLSVRVATTLFEGTRAMPKKTAAKPAKKAKPAKAAKGKK